MIRFIIKRRMDNSYGAVTSHFETLALNVPELEQALTRGGTGQGGPGYDISELVGGEVLPAPNTEQCDVGISDDNAFALSEMAGLGLSRHDAVAFANAVLFHVRIAP